MACLLDTLTNKARRILPRICLILALVSFATAAQAEGSTFLLQLETSDTREIAVQKWEEIKFKNKDVLGTLPMHIAQVALPPENKTSYRTQVGPLASRADAEGLCNTLQNRGVDCYVVETALFASEAAPESIAEATAPAATPAKEEPPAAETAPAAPAAKKEKPSIEVSEVEPVAPAAEAAPAPAAKPHAPTQEELAHADDPDYIPPPVDSGPVIISTWQAPEAGSTATPSTVATQPSGRQVPTENVAQATAPGHYLPGREPHNLDTASSAPVEETAAASPAPAAAPSEATPAKPQHAGFFARLFGASPDKSAAASSGVVGSVNVAEAVRVPLTNNQPPRVRVIPVIPAAVHPLPGYPSDSTARTFWAQIGYFRDEAQALKFYRLWGAAYPQFTDGLRIRITRPFMSSLAANRVSLRVGPFAGTGDVQTICATADRWKARCVVVRDVGASAALGNAPTPHTARAGEEAQETGAYWAQLGTYHSEQEALDAWKALKKLHRSATRHLKPSVTQPPASSAEIALFRLRAGPFKTESRANNACNRLASSATGCVVVSGH